MIRILASKNQDLLKNDVPKGLHKTDRFLDPFFIDSATVLAPNKVPCWPPFSAQDGPRLFNDASQTLQKAAKTAPTGPRWRKTSPNLPRSPPDFNFGAPGPEIWLFLGTIVNHFWTPLEFYQNSGTHLLPKNKSGPFRLSKQQYALKGLHQIDHPNPRAFIKQIAFWKHSF